MRKISIYVFLFMLLLVHFNSVAQLQSYKKGLASFEKGFYEQAILELKKVEVIDESEKGKLFGTIAEAYRLSNRWEEAAPFYKKAIAAGNMDPAFLFYTGYSLKASGQYQEALTFFEKFVEAKSQDKVMNERANRELNTLRIIDEISVQKRDVVFQNQKEINTKGSEFSPVRLGNYLVFTSSKKDKIYANGLPYLGLYKVKVGDDASILGQPELFSPSIFDSERNEGTPTFTPDGKTMVFARGNTGKKKDVSPDVDLYISRFVSGEGWTVPSLVSASDSASWDGTPAFSGDGRTLYFASNRAGGVGGIDLYRVNMDASGRFGKPVNMGKAINTAGDEMFPFVSQEGKLYFASDGHPGLGKLDIFEAVRKDGKISVENMGIPFNSSSDDFGLTSDEFGHIYISSNRGGGVGDDDIYVYQAPLEEEEPVLASTPDGLNPNQPKGTSGSTADIKMVRYFLGGTVQSVAQNSEKQRVEGVEIKIYRLLEDTEELLDTKITTKDGTFGPIPLQEDAEYMLLIEKANYLTKRESFSMYGRSIPASLLTKPLTDTTFLVNIDLDQLFIGKTFRLENIYYDLDKADIRADAAIELDKLVRILQDNPAIKIELGSHTDSRGSDIYNIRLSQRRAESVINYLMTKGIDPLRLQARGYGETELLIENARTEAEHQVNRRTEFKVLEISETAN